jgi:hypothetical protein
MLDFFNAPKLTDEGARAVSDFGAASLNSDTAKRLAGSFHVLAWGVALAAGGFSVVAVGWVAIMMVRELRGESVKHDVTHRDSPPPPPSAPPSAPPQLAG